jgi:CMP-N,N'-diacetyllegionaminic acid synthase
MELSFFMNGQKNNNKITAVIPTRAGSERVKQKNIRRFGDSSLLEIKIQSMLQLKTLGLIKDIMLNSNCPISMEIAERYKIRIHEREERLASSVCDIRDYWRDCATHIETEHMLLAQVTSPFITLKTYKKCVDTYLSTDVDSLITVKKLKEYLWKNNGPLNYKWPQHPKSQDLPDNIHYLTFGVCLISKKTLSNVGNLVGKSPHFYDLEGLECVDIDTELDFEFAEELYKKTKHLLKPPKQKIEEDEYFRGHGY